MIKGQQKYGSCSSSNLLGYCSWPICTQTFHVNWSQAQQVCLVRLGSLKPAPSLVSDSSAQLRGDSLLLQERSLLHQLSKLSRPVQQAQRYKSSKRSGIADPSDGTFQEYPLRALKGLWEHQEYPFPNCKRCSGCHRPQRLLLAKGPDHHTAVRDIHDQTSQAGTVGPVPMINMIAQLLFGSILCPPWQEAAIDIRNQGVTTRIISLN